MQKLLVSLVAIIATIGTTVAGTCGDNTGCKKTKKVRVIHITAGDQKTLSGDDVEYTTTVLKSDGDTTTVSEVSTSDATPEYLSESLVAETYAAPGYASESSVIEAYSEPEPLRITSTRQPNRAGKWYVGGRVGLHLLSWKNKYSGTPTNFLFDKSADHDDYSFEPVFGGNIFAGYRFTPNWRGDIEFGYLTQFTDSDNGFSFKLSTPYLTANAYYDFEGGIYVGLGAGMAFPRATMDNEFFAPEYESETKLSVTGAAMLGYSYNVSESVALDFRYRLAGFYGPKWVRHMVSPNDFHDANNVELQSLETKVGLVIDNSFSFGLRYEF